MGGAGTFQAETKDGLEVTVLYRLRKGWFAVACRGRRMTLRRTQFAADQDEQLSRVPEPPCEDTHGAPLDALSDDIESAPSKDGEPP